MKLTNQELHDKLLAETKDYPFDWMAHHVAYNQEKDLSLDFTTVAWMQGLGGPGGVIELVEGDTRQVIPESGTKYDLFILRPVRC